MSAEGGYNISAFYANHSTVWVDITATALGSSRNATLYTDMAPPLVTTPSVLAPTFVKTVGGKNLYSLQLGPGQSVLLQPAGSTPLGKAVVRAVDWDPIEGVNVTNFWGKHRRAALPCPANSRGALPGLGNCRGPPVPPPAPPPPPPAPPPVTCVSKASPEGYECFDNRCAFDEERVKQHCGDDICFHSHNLAETDSKGSASAAATVTLCSLVSNTHSNASEIAAARCSAYDGCHSFASCPAYTLRCNGTATDSVCFKFFRSGPSNFTVPSRSITLASLIQQYSERTGIRLTI